MNNRHRRIDVTNIHDFMNVFQKSTIGSESLFGDLSALAGTTVNYPPYNLIKVSDDEYRLVMAVAGFTKKDLKVDVVNSTLVISGEVEKGDAEVTYLHRGIAQRNFKNEFKLMEYVVVEGAELNDGLLTITLKREIPEAMKPRNIEIA